MISQMRLTSSCISTNAPITKTSTRPPLYLLCAATICPSEPGGWPLSSSILAARLILASHSVKFSVRKASNHLEIKTARSAKFLENAPILAMPQCELATFALFPSALRPVELKLVQSHMAQKPVLRGEVGCACVAREVSVERGGMGERGCARRLGILRPL